MIRKTLNVDFQLKSLSETGEFAGYASVFGVKDGGNDIVIPGAFTESLARWKSTGRLPPVLWQHKHDEPLGPYTRVEEDEKGLYVEGRLLIDEDPLARRAYAHLKAKSISGISIGYILEDWDFDQEKAAFILKKIDLWEASLVTFPMNDLARVEDVKNALLSGDIPDPRTVEKMLRDVGFSQMQAKRLMSEGYKGLRDVDSESAEIISTINKYFG